MKKLFLWAFILVTSIIGTATFAGNFEIAIWEWVDHNKIPWWEDLRDKMEDKFTGQWWWWAESIRDFMARVWLEILVPVFVFAGIIFALIGFFKLMTATWTEEIWKASQFLLRWVIGIMIMLSAAYIVDQLVWIQNPWEWWIIQLITGWNSSWWAIAAHIYDNIFFPFLRMFIFIILWVMFIFAAINAFNLVFNADESTKSKSLVSLSYAASWIIVIILAKSLVEAIYWTYSSVTDWAANLWEIWEWVISNPDFSILHTIINWTLWLVTFIITITIIYQWYLLLVQPSDEQTISKLKKDFGYIFIWILVIWLAYLLVNVFIVQKA